MTTLDWWLCSNRACGNNITIHFKSIYFYWLATLAMEQFERMKRIEGRRFFLTTCHCPSLMAFPPLVTLDVCWFLNWTSIFPPLSPNMNHESWEDSAYRTTPSGSNVRKSNSAANLTARHTKTGFTPSSKCTNSNVTALSHQSFKKRSTFHVFVCLWLILTLCSAADGSARRWQEGLKTAPQGKASQSVCLLANPHKQGFSHSIYCFQPCEDPDDRHSGTHSYRLCLCKSHRNNSAHTH